MPGHSVACLAAVLENFVEHNISLWCHTHMEISTRNYLIQFVFVNPLSQQVSNLIHSYFRAELNWVTELSSVTAQTHTHTTPKGTANMILGLHCGWAVATASSSSKNNTTQIYSSIFHIMHALSCSAQLGVVESSPPTRPWPICPGLQRLWSLASQTHPPKFSKAR